METKKIPCSNCGKDTECPLFAFEVVCQDCLREVYEEEVPGEDEKN